MVVIHNPIDRFKKSWSQARELKDPHAHLCSLATVSSDGQPSVRVLVLREVNEEGFTIFFSEGSPKWQDLQKQKKYELSVFWPTWMVQYRIQGTWKEMPEDKMKEQWSRKPYSSKLLDHYYLEVQAQSTVIDSREKFLAQMDLLREKYPEESEIPFPTNAKGVILQAQLIEEWIGSPEDRLHERYLYKKKGDSWSRSVLIP